MGSITCIPYGIHPGFAQWKSHVGPTRHPRTKSSGTQMGFPHGSHFIEKMGPMWDPHWVVGWVICPPLLRNTAAMRSGIECTSFLQYCSDISETQTSLIFFTRSSAEVGFLFATDHLVEMAEERSEDLPMDGVSAD